MLSVFDDVEMEAKRNQYARSEWLGATYEKMAPVNVITNLGLVFGFGAARFFLSHSYADYSLAVAFSLLLLWILEVSIAFWYKDYLFSFWFLAQFYHCRAARMVNLESIMSLRV
jgi:hypothetical protein